MVALHADEVIDVHDPATGAILGQVAVSTADDVRAAVARARAAGRSWGALSVAARAKRVARFRDELLARADEVIAAIVAETGKPRPEALGMEVLLVVDLCDYFVKRAEAILAPRDVPLHLMKHRRSTLHHVPRGVVGIIAPWNLPFAIPVGEMLMAVLAGNGVVLKPSEVTPLIALKAKELFDACGLPRDLFQVIPGRAATGAALVEAGVDLVMFTGSVATGKKVAAACGERLIPCVLELGGKAPAVVCADADLERTANALVWGAFAHSGQLCASVERVYAHDTVYDELASRVAELTRGLRQGSPRGEVEVGAMTWEPQVAIVEERVNSALAAGARLLAGGGRARDGARGKGRYFEPTVLGDCRPEMDVMRKEIFGPVLPMMRVGTEDDAVRLANDSHLGLLAYVFTRDRKKGERLATRIEAGTVMVNDVLNSYAIPETPWGGVKQSGIGRTHSDEGLRDLCHVRHVSVDRVAPRRDLWWYPYSDRTLEWMKRGMRLVFGSRGRRFGG
jgi:succinate-semialdehyde dehydrogenase/glutarate-semialdehyde dehydrogenase